MGRRLLGADREHRRPAALLAAIAILALRPVAASASWTPSLEVPVASGTTWQTQAVDGRGDMAVAGVRASDLGPGGSASRVSVVVALRRARGDAFRVRTVMSARRLAVAGVTLALDGGGRATVAWVERRTGTSTVRAAFRTGNGHWSLQTVGRSSAFFNASPRVAAARDGTVALTYYAAVARTPGMAAAWRERSGRFGAVQPLRLGARRSGYLTEPTLAFDPRGTAFLAGAAECGQAPSRGVLYTGSARRRRFAAGRVVAPAPAKSVRMVVTGDGSAVLTWLTGNCTPGSEDLTGVPMAAVVGSAKTAAPAALADAHGYELTLAGAPGGAAATWAVAGANDTLLTATVGNDGTIAAARPPDGGWVPVAATQAGDQLLRQVRPSGLVPFEPLAARPATGGPLEPAPILAAGFPWDAGTAAATDGRALAALSVRGTRRVAALWRPASPLAKAR